MRVLGWLAVAFGLLALVAVPATLAWAQGYPLVTGELQVDGEAGGTPVVVAGEPVTIAGGGFAPGSRVVVTIESEPRTLGEATADARGDVAATVRIPEGFPSGTHTIKATGEAPGGGVLVLAQTVRVVGDDGAEAGLPRTGREVAVLIAVGGLVVMLGGGALAFDRARRALST